MRPPNKPPQVGCSVFAWVVGLNDSKSLSIELIILTRVDIGTCSRMNGLAACCVSVVGLGSELLFVLGGVVRASTLLDDGLTFLGLHHPDP